MSSTLVEYVLNMKGNLSSGIQSATEHANKLESSLSGVQKIAGAIGLAFGAYQIVSFAKESFEAFHALEQVTAKVEANLESTNGAAGMGMKDLQGYAVELSNKIQASRAEVTDMQSQLLTFPAITKDVFSQSMGLVADIAKQTGHGLSETAIMYGKALNSPIDGLQKMMRYGVMFTNEEKQKITALQASGKLIESQKFMMEAISHSGYAGVAEKMFNADIMSKYNKLMENAKLVTGEWVESMMKELLPVMESAANGIVSMVGFIREYGTQIEYLIGAYVAYKGIMLGIILVEKSAIAIKAASAIASELMLAWDIARAEGLGVLTAAQWALNVAMDANPIGLIVAAAVALGAGIYALTQHFGGFTNAMSAAWDFMKVALNLAINLWKSLGEIVVGVLMAPFDRGKMFKQGLSDYVDSVKSAVSQTKDIWNNKDAQEASKKGLVPVAVAGKVGAAGTPGAITAAPKTKAEGQKVINIHVAYNAPLISGFTISTTNIKEGLGNLKEKVSAILVGATHDSLMVADY
jgi:predicted transcriptional regulator